MSPNSKTFDFLHLSQSLPQYFLELVSFKTLWTTILVGVVILSALLAHVVLIIHLVSTCLSMTLSFDLVPFVHATGFSELVHLTTDEAGEKLLGELVVDLLA